MNISITMFCSSCNTHIPTFQPVYCCIDQIFCSNICSNKKLFIIKNKDPHLDNPHDWDEILNNSNNNIKLSELLEKECEIEFIINIRRQKSRRDLILNIEKSNENLLLEMNRHHQIKKYIKLDKLIKDAIVINIICKYKLHIILIILYGIIIYGIYKSICINQ
jgi:hypothetical protein